MSRLRFSYFQLTFGQDEAYLHPEKTYQRLKQFGYDAVEVSPPKGRYGLGVKMEPYARRHQQLSAEFGLGVSCVNECWGEMWDPTPPATRRSPRRRPRTSRCPRPRPPSTSPPRWVPPLVTVATAVHAPITNDNVAESVAVAVDALRRMSDYAASKNIQLVFEATNHLEMGKFVNTVRNHKILIERTGKANLGIQIDWFHVNIEELNPYEAVIEAQPLLRHMHFRDSNSLTPGYGTVDFKAVMRALKRTGYEGYCTIETSPMVPDPDTAARDGIEYLKFAERIAEYQLSDAFPNGYSLRG